MFTPSPALVAFRDTVLRPAGFDVRLVGGCVRDVLWGTDPKDIDLCTDANPDEQMALYAQHGVIFYTTGLAHGTVTINLGPKGTPEVYEITSLRTETDHDGRWATVSYTRDWNLDLGRRDLTVNAMSADLEFNEVYDPFGGQADMKDCRIRFVGRPEDRIREDYLRILRWFRFHARFVGDNPMDEDTANAVARHAQGLKKISRERVWSEVSKIVANYAGWDMLREMMRLGVAKPCSLPHGAWREVQRVAAGTKNPVTRMVAFLGGDGDVLQKLSEDWRWSGEEARLA
ncbi:MAG: CCA tRNA nucleotidyltransferase, partial [Verrucomicrobiaceae bacterium]